MYLSLVRVPEFKRQRLTAHTLYISHRWKIKCDEKSVPFNKYLHKIENLIESVCACHAGFALTHSAACSPLKH